MDSTKTEKQMDMGKKKVKHHFPEGVALKILLRLPVKSLIRFTCISKGWHSVILFDPKFAKDHFKLASEQKTLTPKLLTSDLVTPEVDCSDMEKSFFHNPPLVRKLNSPFEQRPVNLMGSCNGLILVSYKYEDLSVWNPSTGFLHRLPDPCFSIKEDGFYWNHGIGYVSASDDYKVLLCYCAHTEDNNVLTEFMVYSLRVNSWKRIDDPRPEYINVYEATKGVLSHEALHWLDIWDNSVTQQVILAFDLASEEFRTLPVPSFNEDHYWEHMGAFVGGCLCVAGWNRYQNGSVVEEYIEFCRLKEYGVGESWTKLFRFRVFVDSRDDFPLWGLRPIVYTESGTVVLVICCDNGLVRAEIPIENMVGYVRYEPEKEMRVVVKYEETLLSLVDYIDPQFKA